LVDGITSLFRVDTRNPGAPEIHISPPFREFQCTPAGPRATTAFVCAAFDFHSDAWMIENVARRNR
jgi:hypothetical protein